MKIRIGLLVAVALLGVVAAVYLLAIPALPTGYDEIARLRQADIQADGAGEAAPISAPAWPRLPPTVMLTKSPLPPRYALPRTLIETPRQRFLRCWSIVERYSVWGEGADAALKRSCERIQALDSDAYVYSELGSPRSLQLSSEDWEAIDALADPAAYELAVRQYVIAHLNRPASGKPRYLVSGYGGRGQWPRDLKARARQAAQAAPLREAAEILKLPDGAIPAIPPEPQPNSSSIFDWSPDLLLAQAFLHAALHEPAFDAASALRRMHEALEYRRLAAYPRKARPGPESSLRWVANALQCAGVRESRKLTAAAGALLRVAQPDESSSATAARRVEQLRRYHAAAVRKSLLDQYGSCLGGEGNNGNAFHYFYNGKVERLWLRANAAGVRRHIDLYAIAIAGGDEDKIAAARRSLQRVMSLANIEWKNDRELWFDNDLPDLTRPNAFDVEGMRLALAAWVQDHGRLPERLADLAPAYLPPRLLTNRQEVWWLDAQSPWPALVRVKVAVQPKPLREAAHDPRAFREAALKALEKDWKDHPELPKIRRMMNTQTDEQWEQLRRQALLSKHEGANLEVSITGLPFEAITPAPPQ